MAESELSDAEWREVQSTLNEFLDLYITEFGAQSIDRSILADTEYYTILLDGRRNELDELAETLGLDRETLRKRMETEAESHLEGDWNEGEPIVIEKSEQIQTAQTALLERIAQRCDELDSAPGGLDTVAVKDYGYSQRQWALRSGRFPSTVSHNVRQHE